MSESHLWCYHISFHTSPTKNSSMQDLKAGNVTFSIKWTSGRRYMSKFSSWRCPRCILWRPLECCLLSFRQSHQICRLGRSSPRVGPERAAGVYTACLSTVLPVALNSPIFSMISAHLPSLCAHPSVPTNPLDSNSLILGINPWGNVARHSRKNGEQHSIIVCQTSFFLQMIKGFSHMTSRLTLMQF